MEICEFKSSPSGISEVVSEILDSILSQITEASLRNPSPSAVLNLDKMDIEAQNMSSSSSSESEDEIDPHILKINEDSEDESSATPLEKFLTKNEKKPKIHEFENEGKEDREKRYGVFSENLKNEPKRKFGVIQSFFENTVVIRPLVKEVLDLDNVIFSKDEVLGKIDDVFGNVENPFYSILAEPYIKKKLQEGSLKIHDDVFVFEKKVKVLLQSSLQEIKKKSGCDASNVFDEEVNEKEMEFSDDEKEHIMKGKKKRKEPHYEEAPAKPFQGHKEKKYYEKHKEFMYRNNDQSNQIYSRNMMDLNFWGDRNRSDRYGYDRNAGQMNFQRPLVNNAPNNYYGSGQQMYNTGDNFFRNNQIYNPDYYYNDQSYGLQNIQQQGPAGNNNYPPQQANNGNRGFFPMKKYF